MDRMQGLIWRSAVCAAVITVAWTLVGPAPAARASVCGDNFAEAPEACDGTDDSACPGKCLSDCTCAVCGDNVSAAPVETCDGTDDSACPTLCPPPGDPLECLCPVCGDGVLNQPGEACEVGNDATCPGKCLSDCTCAVCGDNVSAAPVETCDGTDDSACPTLCPAPGDPLECRCPVCGDGVLNQPGEVCEVGNDAACPGDCTDSCTCAVCGDNVAEGPETCDGTDDAACPGQCFPPGNLRACQCPITPYKCAAQKEKCVVTKLEHLLKCHIKAELNDLGPADPLCLQKVEDKFDGGAIAARGCFEKLESAAAGQCFTNDDTAAMESKVDAFVSAVVGLVDPSYPAPIIDECSAKKKGCVSKLASALLKCRSKFEVHNVPVDSFCVQKALIKFNGGLFPAKGCFAKLESQNPCMTTNDTSTLEALSTAFARDTACDLDPYQPECSTCGNNITESPPEDCDGTDDLACPGVCTAACRCP